MPAAAGHFEGKVKFLEVDCVDGGKKSVAFCGKHGVRTNAQNCVCSPPQDTLECRPLQHTWHTPRHRRGLLIGITISVVMA